MDGKSKDHERVRLDTPMPPHESIRAAMLAEKRRSGIGPAALISRRRDKPPGLTAALILGWMRGETKIARKDHVEYVLKLWREAVPRAQITDGIRHELIFHQERTGLSAYKLLKGDTEQPASLNSAIISHWIDGSAKTADRQCLEYVLRKWRQMPDSRLSYLDVTAEGRTALRNHADRMGVGEHSLLKRAADAPDGLTAAVIWSWINGKVKRARVDHWEYVIRRWQSLPDDPRPRRKSSPPRRERVPIGKDTLAELCFHRRRTGISGDLLLHRAEGKPEGLEPAIINGWLRGVTASAHPDFVEFALDRWRTLPDKPARPKAAKPAPRKDTPPQLGRENYIPITNEIRDALRSHRQRSGVSSGRLLRKAADKPEGLDAHTIDAWLAGRTGSADRWMLEYVIDRWAQWPSKPR